MGDTNINIKTKDSTKVNTNVEVVNYSNRYDSDTTTKKTNWFLENIVLVIILGVVSSIIASFII